MYLTCPKSILTFPYNIRDKRIIQEMPEIRVTVTKHLDKLLDEVVEAGLFASKADAVRAATVYFLKDLGWLERPRSITKAT